MISHGLIGAALFFLAGTSYDKTHTLFLHKMGATAIYMPKIFTMFSSFSMALLALPGTSGFVAEFLVFLGIVNQKNSFTFKVIITIIEAIGIILTPIYLLFMLRQTFYGYKLSKFVTSSEIDARPREIFISICLFLPIIHIGIHPNLVLFLWNGKVDSIVSQIAFKAI